MSNSRLTTVTAASRSPPTPLPVHPPFTQSGDTRRRFDSGAAHEPPSVGALSDSDSDFDSGSIWFATHTSPSPTSFETNVPPDAVAVPSLDTGRNSDVSPADAGLSTLPPTNHYADHADMRGRGLVVADYRQARSTSSTHRTQIGHSHPVDPRPGSYPTTPRRATEPTRQPHQARRVGAGATPAGPIDARYRPGRLPDHLAARCLP